MTKRVYRWDWLKLVLIFLVVFGHLLDRTSGRGELAAKLDYWIYLFHMPAFIFVSGLFAKHNIQQRRWGKIFSLFGYYLIAKLVLFVSQWLMKPGQPPTFSLLSESSIPWYLFVMFWFELGAVLVDRFDHRLVLLGVVGISLFAPYIPWIGDWLVSARFVGFVPFFYLGYMFEPTKLAQQLQARPLRVVGAAILLLALVGVWVLYPHLGSTWGLITCRLPYVNMGQLYVHYGPLLRLIVQTGILALILSLATLMPESAGPLVRLGARTLQIFVFHIPMIWLVNDLLHFDRLVMRVVPFTVISNLLIAVVILLLCVTPPISWLTAGLFHPKKTLAQVRQRVAVR